MANKCEDCKYSVVASNPQSIGQKQRICRRNPPQVFASPAGITSSSPVVLDEWFCGEFHPNVVQ